MCRLIIEKLVEPQQPLKNLSIVESSSSRQESPHQPSLSKQVEQHSEQQIVDTPAQVDMDYTKTEIIATNPHLPQKALILARDDSSSKQIDTSASKLKTWKRVGNKEGRLQRKQQEGLQIDIRNGATVRLQDFNWIPGIKGRYPHLKNPPATGKLWVKDLIQRDNGQWDELRLRELIEEEDCREILKIQTLDPLLDDKWSWKMGVKEERGHS
ncbi:beta glucosidase 43 [Striga asiatica]|uniref:Beta glucosidase 43 n=1 Tax=Striga asiatica TaxID=4170 RepID=A0A5A7QTQ5_STRAF|nr:beta glucosidase 43 [Striga asiatica]